MDMRVFNILLDIENNLGVFAEWGIPRQHQRDAGRLYDAILHGDRATALKVVLRYQSELPKGDVSGGPKEVKPGDIVRHNLAHYGLLGLDVIDGKR